MEQADCDAAEQAFGQSGLPDPLVVVVPPLVAALPLEIARPSQGHAARRVGGGHLAGLMFAFSRNRFSGSYLAFNAARRAWFAPTAARPRSSPASPRLLTYAPPVANGRIASQKLRAQVIWRSSSAGFSQIDTGKQS